jgi:hypothetical protein
MLAVGTYMTWGPYGQDTLLIHAKNDGTIDDPLATQAKAAVKATNAIVQDTDAKAVAWTPVDKPVQWDVSDSTASLRPAEPPYQVTLPFQKFRGQPQERVRDHVPNLYLETHGKPMQDPGMPFIRNHIVVLFKESATVAEANQILRSLQGQVVGALASAGLVVIAIPDPGSLEKADEIVETLKRNPAVESVCLNSAHTSR